MYGHVAFVRVRGDERVRVLQGKRDGRQYRSILGERLEHIAIHGVHYRIKYHYRKAEDVVAGTQQRYSTMLAILEVGSQSPSGFLPAH